MKLVAIADTHGQHAGLRELPHGDVLIHAGDFCSHGNRESAVNFLTWFGSQPHEHKILIAGNHDRFFEKHPTHALALVRDLAPGAFYLCDSGVQIDGINFWGSPVQPEFLNWAFNRNRGIDIRRHWNMIPDYTNVLITHGPAHGHLDLLKPDFFGNGKNDRAGCEDLRQTIDTRLTNLKAHIFGHLHYQGGQTDTVNGVQYFNVAMVDDGYTLCRKPAEIYV